MSFFLGGKTRVRAKIITWARMTSFWRENYRVSGNFGGKLGLGGALKG